MKSYTINKNCTFCGGCASLCPVSAIIVEDRRVTIENSCIACKNCYDFCPISAIDEGERV